MSYETNIFPILNLGNLTSNYRLFAIKGLQNDDDYDSNIQYIIRSLSFNLRHPVTVITQNELPFLVTKDDKSILKRIPGEFPVKKKNIIYFIPTDEIFSLNFNESDNDRLSTICIRFLQFDIQSELNKIQSLWQPASGKPFFDKNSFDGTDDIEIFNGFIPRLIALKTGGYGISIDVTKKYISRKPLDKFLNRTDFNKIKKSHFVYHYGNCWYEVKLDEYCDLNVSQCKYIDKESRESISLLEDLKKQFSPSLPPEIAKLPDNATVLMYRNNNLEERRVPAALCYKVYDTEEYPVNKLHNKSILPPHIRRKYINHIVSNYLQNVNFGNQKLKISQIPLNVEKKYFLPPDLEFRNNNIISVKGTNGAKKISIINLGEERKKLLQDENIGVYINRPFDRQYFILPQSVYETYGNENYFLKDLIREVNKLHSTKEGWNPTILTYDDINQGSNVLSIGIEILSKIQKNIDPIIGGYGIIMIPRIKKTKAKGDELSALCVSKSFEMNLNAAIMHTDTLNECFDYKSVDGLPTYFITKEKIGKYKGYVKGVALNQVILNNERWPFILNTPLHADVIIGIDVKNHIAGYTIIDKYSKNIRTVPIKSSLKEQLSENQVMMMITNLISKELDYIHNDIKNIVIHRDGRLYNPEKRGIFKAINKLKEEERLSSEVKVSIVEIPKKSIIPFRLFERIDNNGEQTILNPQIGSYYLISNNEAYLCTTGREFSHKGTSNPLLIKLNESQMKFEHILEDIYFLSNLAYTKPDDCSRYPITIKITDRRINSLGGEFDSEELEYLQELKIEEYE